MFESFRENILYDGRPDHNNNVLMKSRVNKSRTRVVGLYEFGYDWIAQMEKETNSAFCVFCHDKYGGIREWCEF